VDFKAGRLRVRMTKGEGGAGLRSLPISAPLRKVIRAEWMAQGQPATGLVCRGPKGGAPDYDSMKTRAGEVWKAARLKPIGFHECRHTFITMIASGLNAKAVSVLAGHASIDVTFDRHGHLFPGHEDEAGAMLDSFYAAQPVSNAVSTSADDAPVSNLVSNEAR
jgi:integrase